MKQLRTFFSRRPFVYGFLLGLVVVTLLAFLFEWHNGSHPECAVNDSVGPCDVPGRVRMYWPLSVYAAIGLGAASTALKLWLDEKKRPKKSTPKRSSEQEKMRLNMWLSLSVWMIAPLGLISLFIFVLAPLFEALGLYFSDAIFIPSASIMQIFATVGWVLPLVFGYRYWRFKREKK